DGSAAPPVPASAQASRSSTAVSRRPARARRGTRPPPPPCPAPGSIRGGSLSASFPTLLRPGEPASPARPYNVVLIHHHTSNPRRRVLHRQAGISMPVAPCP